MGTTKICTGCREAKTVTEFGVNNATLDRLAYYCRPCAKARNDAWKKANPERVHRHNVRSRSKNRQAINARARIRSQVSHREETRAAKRRIIERNRAHVNAIKLAAGCVECGYKEHAELLEFDHVRGVKVANVSRLAFHGASLARIDAEIAKCELVCQHHHRLRTLARAPKRVSG